MKKAFTRVSAVALIALALVLQTGCNGKEENKKSEEAAGSVEVASLDHSGVVDPATLPQAPSSEQTPASEQKPADSQQSSEAKQPSEPQKPADSQQQPPAPSVDPNKKAELGGFVAFPDVHEVAIEGDGELFKSLKHKSFKVDYGNEGTMAYAIIRNDSKGPVEFDVYKVFTDKDGKEQKQEAEPILALNSFATTYLLELFPAGSTNQKLYLVTRNAGQFKDMSNLTMLELYGGGKNFKITIANNSKEDEEGGALLILTKDGKIIDQVHIVLTEPLKGGEIVEYGPEAGYPEMPAFDKAFVFLDVYK